MHKFLGPLFVAVHRLSFKFCFSCSMAMTTLVQAQVSKRDTVMLGGNMALRSGLGRGSVTMGLRRQLSPISTVEFLAMAGLRSILSLQTSRYVVFIVNEIFCSLRVQGDLRLVLVLLIWFVAVRNCFMVVLDSKC